MKPKWGWYELRLFFKIGLRSAISFKRSRRELSIDVAEHQSPLKNYQNTHYPVLVPYPKQVQRSPRRGFCLHFVPICTVKVILSTPRFLSFLEPRRSWHRALDLSSPSKARNSSGFLAAQLHIANPQNVLKGCPSVKDKVQTQP